MKVYTATPSSGFSSTLQYRAAKVPFGHQEEKPYHVEIAANLNELRDNVTVARKTKRFNRVIDNIFFGGVTGFMASIGLYSLSAVSLPTSLTLLGALLGGGLSVDRIHRENIEDRAMIHKAAALGKQETSK
ncbi:MAG: hypothetical protein KTR14_05745 [Vampirovibrio sp.]|nr:hypothetical protein [Vampirovibrio sp.]